MSSSRRARSKRKYQQQRRQNERAAAALTLKKDMEMKITESWLQAHLVKPRDENGIKVKSPFLELKDGGRISVQASATHYCSPKSDFGPYISAEVFPVDLPPAGRDIIEQLYSGDRQVWGWVAIDQIVELINACGGVKTA